MLPTSPILTIQSSPWTMKGHKKSQKFRDAVYIKQAAIVHLPTEHKPHLKAYEEIYSNWKSWKKVLMEIWIAKAECGRDKKGEYAEWSAIIWKQMLWSLGTGFGLLIKMAENVLTVSEAMPQAPALHCSNFSLLVMQWYIYAETCYE